MGQKKAKNRPRQFWKEPSRARRLIPFQRVYGVVRLVTSAKIEPGAMYGGTSRWETSLKTMKTTMEMRRRCRTRTEETRCAARR